MSVEAKMAESEDSEDGDLELPEEEEDEEGLIRYYFFRGFEYKEIRLFLFKNHGIEMSLSTLKRRIKQYGLKRQRPDYDIDDIRQSIQSIVNGPGCLQGYRSVWHTLQLKGKRVPRIVVQELLKEIDPEGSELRKAHRLKKRKYHNPGPNYAWHCDGYDKLKPFGFAIHGCIDGWSRKIMWLYVTRSNNQPNNVAAYYLDAVEEYGGCPVDLVTDLGTENGIMAAIQSFLRDDPDSHRYVPSPRNQRIEAWWAFLRKSHSTWWINFFKDMVEGRVVDLTSELEMECLWFCFSGLLQKILDEVKEHWNTHRIRGSRHDTMSGRPDSLFYLPELHGSTDQFLLPISEAERNYARSHVIEIDSDNEYQEYFQYVSGLCGLEQPNDWREALELYDILLQFAYNGSTT
ncbi:uncharacterized protein LOC144656265 [Oculina patagonica]